jgi:hypothetical protein
MTERKPPTGEFGISAGGPINMVLSSELSIVLSAPQLNESWSP